jgi:hypothetical protein
MENTKEPSEEVFGSPDTSKDNETLLAEHLAKLHEMNMRVEAERKEAARKHRQEVKADDEST